MKKFLLLTDFSVNARNAADYGYQLAKQLKSDIILCNAVTIPAEIPQAGLVVWPMEETDLLLDESHEELKSLKAALQQNDHTEEFRPDVSFIDKAGTIKDVVNEVVKDHHIEMVIMATHASNGLSTFLLSNHATDIIDDSLKSLLIISPKAKFKPVKKIAFAIAFDNPESDLAEIFRLIPIARKLNAEILITHIHKEKDESADFKKWIGIYLTELSNKADYPHIYYRIVNSDTVENGLKWLCEHGQVDMLAILHHQHGFFDALFHKSHTEQMVSQVTIPLLILSN